MISPAGLATPDLFTGRMLAGAGFEFVKDFGETPIIHTLHVAVFKRRAA